MNFISLLLFVFSFVFSGEGVFFIKDSLYSTNNLFNKFSKRDWTSQSVEQKTKVLDQYINQELALIEAKQIGLQNDPYINIKIKKREKEQKVRFAFEWFSCFSALSHEELVFGQEKIVKDYKLKMILLSHKDSNSRSKSTRTKQEAYTLANFVSKNSSSLGVFDSLMAIYSEDPSIHKNKGYLGWYGWGSLMKEFDDKIFIQNIGEATRPIDTSVGYVVLFLEDERPSRYASLSAKQIKDIVIDASIRRLPVETKKGLYESLKKNTLDSLKINFNTPFLEEVIKHYNHENNKRKVSGQYKTDVIVALEAFNKVGVVCTIGEKGYGLKWFLNKIKNLPFSKRPKFSDINDVLSSLNDIILRHFIIDLFNKKNLYSNYVYNSRKSESLSSLLFNEYYKHIINNAEKPDSINVTEYYNNNKNVKYLVKPTITLREIKVSTISLADSLYGLVKKGVPFEAVAADFSLTNPNEGGFVGPVEESSFKNYYTMTKNLTSGQISGIYDNNDNTYSFVYLIDRRDEYLKPLNLVYKKIESLITKNNQDKAKLSSLKELPVKHKVKRCSFLNYKYLEKFVQPDSSFFYGYFYSKNKLNYIIKDVVVDSSKRGFVLKQNSENFWVYTLGNNISTSKNSNVVAGLNPDINKHLYIKDD